MEMALKIFIAILIVFLFVAAIWEKFFAEKRQDDEER